MKNQSSKIIVIEGIWGVGKSTVISNLRNTYPVLFVPEPHHIQSGVKSKIAEWYRAEHLKRMGLAKTYCNYGENVIMERSIIASVAFYYAQHCSIPKWFYSYIDKIPSLSNMHIIFLYSNKKTFLSKIPEIENKNIVKIVSADKCFYDNYIYFYKEVLPKLIKNNIVYMKMSKDRSLSIDDNNYIKKLLSNGRHNTRKKLKEVKEYCSSAVIFYKDKFLTIYSKNHKQYVLPQGHQEEGESALDVIKREVVEETGFKDFTVISEIKTYSYRFFNKGVIIHKIITCFLIELNTFKKTKKSLESHESYRNYFFTDSKVVKKLNWAEDKGMIYSALKIMSKNSPSL
jgi:8-oxo-dGTP pyrophosphatase MutT (NUDIX family)/thymidylate kinase